MTLLLLVLAVLDFVVVLGNSMAYCCVNVNSAVTVAMILVWWRIG